MDIDNGNDDARASPDDLANETPPKTCEQVLEESILELIQLGYDNGMTRADVDDVLYKIIDDRAHELRGSFKMHESGDETENDDE